MKFSQSTRIQFCFFEFLIERNERSIAFFPPFFFQMIVHQKQNYRENETRTLA